jgi:4-hydroxy-tetrahydrodipicolinate reductase
VSGDGAIRVAVAGARGKMGRVAVEAFSNSTPFTYAGGLARAADASAQLYDSLDALIERGRPDVLLDVTTHPDSVTIAMRALERGVRPVVGASGWSDAEREALAHAAETRGIGALIVPNFSTGALLMMRFAREAARYYGHAEIVEMHHLGKKDAPSGTALQTARGIASDGGAAPPIHSVRLPGPTAHQEVLFGGPGELLTIAHDAFGRESFVRGMLTAARAVMHLRGLTIGLDELLEAEPTSST